MAYLLALGWSALILVGVFASCAVVQAVAEVYAMWRVRRDAEARLRQHQALYRRYQDMQLRELEARGVSLWRPRAGRLPRAETARPR